MFPRRAADARFHCVGPASRRKTRSPRWRLRGRRTLRRTGRRAATVLLAEQARPRFCWRRWGAATVFLAQQARLRFCWRSRRGYGLAGADGARPRSSWRSRPVPRFCWRSRRGYGLPGAAGRGHGFAGAAGAATVLLAEQARLRSSRRSRPGPSAATPAKVAGTA